MQHNTLFSKVLLNETALSTRLYNELLEALSDLKQDPKSYIASAIRREAGSSRRRLVLRMGLALALAIYAIAFAAMLALGPSLRENTERNRRPPYVVALPPYSPGSLPVGETDRDPRGGGGGGREADSLASQGQLARFSLRDPIIAPTTRPTLAMPLMPMVESLIGDPAVNIRRDELIMTGLPDGIFGPPSDGPGRDGGIGTGNAGGIGPGSGPGAGPGKDGGAGGDSYEDGRRRARPGAAVKVDSRPVPLNRPQPMYTEEARKNKTQGTVLVRVLVGSDGRVEQVTIVRGLPDGLNEQAIQAVYKLRFRPATRDGIPVRDWIPVQIDFAIR